MKKEIAITEADDTILKVSEREKEKDNNRKKKKKKKQTKGNGVATADLKLFIKNLKENGKVKLKKEKK